MTIAIALTNPVMADEHWLGIRGGFDIETVDNDTDKTDPVMGPTFGIYYEYFSTGKLSLNSKGKKFMRFGIEIGAEYQRRGAEFNTGTKRLTYIGFPHVLKVHFIDFSSLGIGFNYQTLYSSTMDHVHKDNVEFIFTYGVYNRLTKHFIIGLDFKMNFGIINFSKDPAKSYKTNAMEFLMGMRYRMF